MAITLDPAYATDQERLLGSPQSTLFTLKMDASSIQMFGTFLSQSPRHWDSNDVLLLVPHEGPVHKTTPEIMHRFSQEILRQTKPHQTCDVTKIAIRRSFIQTFLNSTINALARFPSVVEFFVFNDDNDLEAKYPTVPTTWAFDRESKEEGVRCWYIANGRKRVYEKPEETVMDIRFRPEGFEPAIFDGEDDGEPLRSLDGKIVHVYFAKMVSVVGPGAL